MDFSNDYSLDPALQQPPVMPARGSVAPAPLAALPRTPLHGIFISRSYAGQVYVAHRSFQLAKFIWYTLPYAPTAPYVRIIARKVPRSIRYQAYRWLKET
jgi:hypothetical protein